MNEEGAKPSLFVLWVLGEQEQGTRNSRNANDLRGKVRGVRLGEKSVLLRAGSGWTTGRAAMRSGGGGAG